MLNVLYHNKKMENNLKRKKGHMRLENYKERWFWLHVKIGQGLRNYGRSHVMSKKLGRPA